MIQGLEGMMNYIENMHQPSADCNVRMQFRNERGGTLNIEVGDSEISGTEGNYGKAFAPLFLQVIDTFLTQLRDDDVKEFLVAFLQWSQGHIEALDIRMKQSLSTQFSTE